MKITTEQRKYIIAYLNKPEYIKYIMGDNFWNIDLKSVEIKPDWVSWKIKESKRQPLIVIHNGGSESIISSGVELSYDGDIRTTILREYKLSKLLKNKL